MPDPERRITVPQMCATHQSLLVHQLGFTESDPWRVLIIVANIALFQAATADPAFYARVGGDVSRLPEIGCLGCYKPDRFGELIEAARHGDPIGAIKTLGETWVQHGAHPPH